MKRLLLYILVLGLSVQCVLAQKDTARNNAIISEIDYDELFTELDGFIDSLTKPQSFTLVNISAGNRMFNYINNTTSTIQSNKNLSFSPSVGYFNKNGLGINVAAAIVKEENRLNAYQYLATVSYDYVKKRNFLTGVSYTRYFTKDSLSFYTSPLQNEAFAYLSYRKSFVKPTLSASFGWGSRSEVEEREHIITTLIKKGRGKSGNNGNGNGNGNGSGTIVEDIIVEEINTIESVRDLNVTFSLSHDFNWLDVFISDDIVRFSPQISITGGTQKFGFNQNIIAKGNSKILNGNTLFGPQSYSLDEKTKFQPLAVTTFLKSEFSKGKFFFQPQLVFDYYLPEAAQKLTTTFVVSSGFMF